MTGFAKAWRGAQWLGALLVLIAAGSTNLARAGGLLTGHLPEQVASGQARGVGALPGEQQLTLDLVLPLSNAPALRSLLAQLYDPQSPRFHQFLTPQQFTASFGPSAADYQSLLAFARVNGFAVIGGSRDGMDVVVRASVQQIQAAFHVNLRTYQHPTEDRLFYAPDREPTHSLPFALWHISGLDNYATPKPRLVQRRDAAQALGLSSEQLVPHATTGSGPSASYLGSDMRAAYYNGAYTGSGQTIGLLEFYGTNLADLQTYYSNIGQSFQPGQVTLVSTDGSSTSCLHSSGCDDAEQTLDITQALGMAPGANVVVYVGASDTAILSRLTTASPLPLTIGCSWGWGPVDPTVLDPYFQKMAAQGQTFLAASGDHSTWNNASGDTAPWPADDPYVVSVGGTDLVTTGPAGAWSAETAWLDSGGGISPNHFAIPAWQQLAGVASAANKASSSYRNGPDVAANANFTFYVCANQSACTANAYGGTSFAAPMWAGYLALVNQQLRASAMPSVGFLNPTIYGLNAKGTNYASDFHDVTSGSSGSYSATSGFDLVTGWGSPNQHLPASLMSALQTVGFSVSASPAALTVTPGASVTTRVLSTTTGGFASAVGFSISGLPSGVTASFSPSSLAGTGNVTLTLTASSTAALGAATLTVSGKSGSQTQTTTLALTVAAPPGFALAVSPTSLTITAGNTGSATLTDSVTGGFASAVALSISGLPAGATATLTPASLAGAGSSTLRITTTASTPAGNYTLTLKGASGTTTHSTTLALTVAAAPGFAVALSPASQTITRSASAAVTGKLTVTESVTGGFSSAVSLSASGLPSGTTAAFSPGSLGGAGSASLTLSVGSKTAAGTYTITVTGSGGGLSHAATATVTIK